MSQINAATQELYRAIEQGEALKFDWALANGADVNADGGEPMRLAAAYKRSDLAEKLYNKGADIIYPLEKAKQKYESCRPPMFDRYDAYNDDYLSQVKNHDIQVKQYEA